MIPSLHGLVKSHSNVIPLICSIFLANQGASDGVEEGQSSPLVSTIITDCFSVCLLMRVCNSPANLKNTILTQDSSWVVLISLLGGLDSSKLKLFVLGGYIVVLFIN